MARHTAPEEQRRLVELWRRSETSIAVFARAHAVRPRTFSSWVRRHPPEMPATAEPSEPPPARLGFVQAAPASERISVRIGGLELGFEEPPPARWFAAVLRELREC